MGLETHAPGWEWYYIALYFFVGGVSAGAYFIGSLMVLFGSERLQPLSRIAYYVAFPLILICPPLLIGDLGRPERFWHLMFYSRNGLPVVNLQSPMSVGSWGLLLFGLMAALSFADNLVADGRIKFAPFARAYNRIPRRIYAAIGSLAGFFVAGYTGVLLNITARPFWAATNPLMGFLFMASAGSTGAAAIYLILAVRRLLAGGRAKAGSREPERGEAVTTASLQRFEHFDSLAKLVELALILALLVVAGQYAAPLLRGPYALWFWIGTVLLGILTPLIINWFGSRPGQGRALPPAWSIVLAVLVLAGGALLRIVMVQAGQV